MNIYEALPLDISGKESFLDASREELAVLLLLVERNGMQTDADAISKSAGISKARAVSAVSYWVEAGVVRVLEQSDNITYEFENKLKMGTIVDENAKVVAKTIRDESLIPLITECEDIIGKHLNTTETKEIVALHTQYGLDDEYIATLASYISKTHKITAKSLVNRALKLVDQGIDTVKELTDYIESKEGESESEYAFKKLFGINNRNLAKTERELFRKWSREYGYFTNIVGEAYDIAVMSDARTSSPAYIDKILTKWYNAGCRTLEECREYNEREKDKRKAERAETKRKPREVDVPKYSNFDVEDAFQKALERSYGKKEEN